MQPRIPPTLVIAVAIVGISLVTLGGVMLPALWYELATRRDPARIAFAVIAMGGVLVLYGRLLWQNLMRRTHALHRVGLVVVTVLSCALPGALGDTWVTSLIAPAGLIPLVLPLRQAIVVTAAGTLGISGYGLLLGFHVLTVVFEFFWFPFAALSGFVSIWMFHVVQELREARAELARAAVGEERQRFARDLHDVLGHSLQAVALRAEVAERYLDRDQARVRKELTEIQRMARDSVRDVREVVRGYRATSLRAELEGASAVLRAAGIGCEPPEMLPDLPPHVHQPLGWVAREAVTNVLRHSAATRCRIEVGATADGVRLEIVNDGAGRRAAGEGGSGLVGLSERIAAAGGEFTAGHLGDGTFRVTATVPQKGP
ncbi:sensor histidine kinase [Thermomonospora umbrina]|uniref:Two-component system sensor histidine kinase DesK n=1 Tax=Thermomonospora umbrina TaxID=111806 RepID=A0A3D9SHR5_9ACTN|nr:sensor histidine kinase [Thermomonospora umbrina]REE95449.1 two-component system sensor histidine kinase DesK [Thermomonospora umbrina]